MSLKMFSMTATIVVTIAVLTACSSISAHHNALLAHGGGAPGSVSQPADPISGEWNVTFYVHEMKTPATFSFALDGTKLTGTANSDHTGAGTIRDGKYVDGKLSFTLDFKKHESIAVNGALTDGKLAGEFTTEGFTDKWEATKK